LGGGTLPAKVAHMATDKARVCGYVDPALAELIDETASALGQSRSALISEMLSNAGPVLVVLRDMALALAEAPERHRQVLASLAEAFGPMVDDAHSSLEGLSALGDVRPPTSNRGVIHGN